MTDDDWPIDKALTTARAKIDALLPLDWAFYGPIRLPGGDWAIGVHESRPPGRGIEAHNADLGEAFRELAGGIQSLNLTPRQPN
jgi:hypothetical protein